MERLIISCFGIILLTSPLSAQAIHRSVTAAHGAMIKLPDTGQSTDYTALPGEDSDILINVPTYTINGDGTVTDAVTGLMWQQTDGGEMTAEKAAVYCDTLTLAGFQDWRMPTAMELFSILHHDKLNPAQDITVFPKTLAEYWWGSEHRVDDAARIWAANAGGGIGAHPKSETISAGGAKHFHIRAVRTPRTQPEPVVRFFDHGNGTVTDRLLGLVWQKVQPAGTMTWEDALRYADTLTAGSFTDWRLPNIKELQSLNDPFLTKPSIDKAFFTAAVTGRYWSSTTQFNAATRAWYLDTEFGIVTYDLKTVAQYVLCVRGAATGRVASVDERSIPGGEFEMGDHHGFVDPAHPSDELPVHKVLLSPFLMSAVEMSNAQAVDLLNAAMASGAIDVRGNCVFLKGGTDTLLFLNPFASYSSIAWDGKLFSVMDFRAAHPLVGVMWKGAAALCNWLSVLNGLVPCYDLSTGTCDFTKSGYRLPTEAEWEFAGRGGNLAPYLIYPSGSTIVQNSVNLPASGDPYETGAYPNTTPVGFYDGAQKLKSVYGWPSAVSSYQTANGANAYGLYDMQGNVWEFVNDWYGQNYYSSSPYDNPKGPATGFLMPDGKPYRGMRGGNWYNGLVTAGVNDGHSRVANRNPSYYRGPQDPYHPYYHLGFRVVRGNAGIAGRGAEQSLLPSSVVLLPNFPNPFNPSTTIRYSVPRKMHVRVEILSSLGQRIAVLLDDEVEAGTHSMSWDAGRFAAGLYICSISAEGRRAAAKMLLIK